MSITYYASEVDPEEYTVVLEEAAILAIADHKAHISEQDVKIGDIIKDENSRGQSDFYRIADIVDEQWYPSLVMLERLTYSGWEPTPIQLHELLNPVKAEPRNFRLSLSGLPIGGLFKTSNLNRLGGLMQRVQNTKAGTLRVRYLDGQFAGEVICKSKYSQVYPL